ncbi:MAG: hypothetical protein OMM_11673 [Candidatus Magnetoglobus multicellularis str. Araruama]|uniref:ATPase domain protein, prokaryote domain protein n=1 Tax=Candidatus Magnetoglobus multicellularis str. Araruama TaxID=890399 RepID=A0A1V1NXT7_9BACT|nr:MAG: hypothetical protein OMM_11673 [Candidatus Magnetoglobus multicellularis str. Araruama]
MNKNQFAIKTLVPDEIYTNRKEFLELFYNEALKASTRRTSSMVLLGQRRMGKTEIFKRVINRLFYEQDYKDPNTVVPVYYIFPDHMTDPWKFSIEYVENFIRWYAAFRTRNPDVLDKGVIRFSKLRDLVNSKIEITNSVERAFSLIEVFNEKECVYPEQEAVNLPRTISDRDDSTIVMFLDEVQNLHLPQHDFRVVGYMQSAVESPTCPHFVTGSAMTILNDILGKGSLYGRFDAESIKPLTIFYGAELVGKTSAYFNADIPEIMRPVISEKCGGNPFYIKSVVQRSAKLNEPLSNEEAINRILAIDLSSGFIYQELRDQVIKWIDRLNDHNITKWILYLAALEEADQIDPERIQKELKVREGTDVEVKKIIDVMIKLSQGDLIDYKSFGGYFTHINDPVLNDFLKVWGKVEVERTRQDYVVGDTVFQYESLKRKYKDYQGYLAEVFMIQVLWNNQKRTIEGKHFNHPEAIKIPGFIYIDQRYRLGSGKGKEIDIFAAAGRDFWIAESKWHKDPVDVKVVRNLIRQKDLVREKMGKNVRSVTLWLFASSGVTVSAKKILEDNSILWSTKEQLNSLLENSGLRKLPEID